MISTISANVRRLNELGNKYQEELNTDFKDSQKEAEIIASQAHESVKFAIDESQAKLSRQPRSNTRYQTNHCSSQRLMSRKRLRGKRILGTSTPRSKTHTPSVTKSQRNSHLLTKQFLANDRASDRIHQNLLQEHSISEPINSSSHASTAGKRPRNSKDNDKHPNNENTFPLQSRTSAPDVLTSKQKRGKDIGNGFEAETDNSSENPSNTRKRPKDTEVRISSGSQGLPPEPKRAKIDRRCTEQEEKLVLDIVDKSKNPSEVSISQSSLAKCESDSQIELRISEANVRIPGPERNGHDKSAVELEPEVNAEIAPKNACDPEDVSTTSHKYSDSERSKEIHFTLVEDEVLDTGSRDTNTDKRNPEKHAEIELGNPGVQNLISEVTATTPRKHSNHGNAPEVQFKSEADARLPRSKTSKYVNSCAEVESKASQIQSVSPIAEAPGSKRGSAKKLPSTSISPLKTSVDDCILAEQPEVVFVRESRKSTVNDVIPEPCSPLRDTVIRKNKRGSSSVAPKTSVTWFGQKDRSSRIEKCRTSRENQIPNQSIISRASTKYPSSSRSSVLRHPITTKGDLNFSEPLALDRKHSDPLNTENRQLLPFHSTPNDISGKWRLGRNSGATAQTGEAGMARKSKNKLRSKIETIMRGELVESPTHKSLAERVSKADDTLRRNLSSSGFKTRTASLVPIVAKEDVCLSQEGSKGIRNLNATFDMCEPANEREMLSLESPTISPDIEQKTPDSISSSGKVSDQRPSTGSNLNEVSAKLGQSAVQKEEEQKGSFANLMTSITSFLPSSYTLLGQRSTTERPVEVDADMLWKKQKLNMEHREMEMQTHREAQRLMKQRETEEKQRNAEMRRLQLAKAEKKKEEDRRRKEERRLRKKQEEEEQLRLKKDEEDKKKKEHRKQVEKRARNLVHQRIKKGLGPYNNPVAPKASSVKEGRVTKTGYRSLRSPVGSGDHSTLPPRTPVRKKSEGRTGILTYAMTPARETILELSDEEEERRKHKKIPQWARGSNPSTAARAQPDPDGLFINVPTCDLSALFGNVRRFRPRSSSANWARDRLTAQERMRFRRGLDEINNPNRT